MSSIFEKKIEFDGKKYRIPIFKEGFYYIYINIKELEVLETKKETKFHKSPHLYSERDLNPHGRNGHWILSPTCLPIPPSELDYERKTGFEPATLTLAR